APTQRRPAIAGGGGGDEEQRPTPIGPAVPPGSQDAAARGAAASCETKKGSLMTPEEFRRIGHRLIDWVADYRAKVAELPVMSPATPGSIRARLPAPPPEQPESWDAVFRDLEQTIVPGLSHWQHPSFFGYFPSNGELSSVLGDYLSPGLGVLGLSWQSSPALTELEEVVVGWVRQMVGLSESWSGVIQDTASTSTLVALLCARERSTRYALDRGGLQAEAKPLVVYASGQSHSSVEKAALLAGFGRHYLRKVETDEKYALRPAALAAAVKEDAARGLVPCAVVATTGTTASCAIDPLAPIAEIAAQHGLWMHVGSGLGGLSL